MRVTVSAVEKHLAALRACERCPRMHRPVVVGRTVASRILLVGQAPGDKEPKLGRRSSHSPMRCAIFSDEIPTRS